MKRALTWVGGAAVAVVVAGVAGAAWIWFASEAHLKSFPAPPPFTAQVLDDADAIARGEHLVATRGCRGCHGDDLAGQLMWDYALAVNLRAFAQRESLATFEAALRHAIGADGRALYSMPAFSFVRLRDEDVADIYAYLRSLPAKSRPLPAASLPWHIRYDLARGADQAIPGFLHLVPPLTSQDDPDPRVRRGEYIAMTTCIECHGFSLRADSPFPDENAPPLIVVAGYDAAAFEHLMRTGKALGNRELPMMSGVARGRFAHFTDDEVDEVYAFLSRRAAQDARQSAARQDF